MTPRDETLAAIFEAMQPRRDRGSTEPSETRAYIRANFDTIQSARQRGLTWPQITEALIQAGVKAADGSPLQWRALKSLFHAERYTRGERRKRQTKKSAILQPAPQPQTQARTPYQPAAPATPLQKGSELTASHVAALYASEKKARGIRPKRRLKKTKQPLPTTAQQPRDAVTFDPDDGAPQR